MAAASCKKVFVLPENPPIKDSVVIRDSIIIRDSVVMVYDTIRVSDTLTVVDTVQYNDTLVYRDTVIHNDTLKIVETIRKIDTVTYADTIWTEEIITIIDTLSFRDTVIHRDTVRIFDTVKVVDTVRVIDTVRVFDTIKIYDTIRVSLPPPLPPPTQEGSIVVGSGSGNLTIDNSTLNGQEVHTIRIRSGTYSSVTIDGLNGTPDAPITIINDGPIYIQQVLTTRNIGNVEISGAGSGSSDHGITFENLNYRAIRMHGKINGVTIRNMHFRNIPDYCIAGEATNGSGLQYDGTTATRNERFKILHCIFDNVGTIIFGGQLSRSGDTGFFKDVEIAYNTFINSEAGNLVIFSNVQDYDIHHNVVDQVNQRNNQHNGIFLMHGNGVFHDNKLTNFQGNAIRAWAYSRGSSAATLEIYNNICYHTRKYSAFEIQEFASQQVAGKSTFVNAKVYNNTVGRMNTSRDWQGQLLDLYDNSGTLAYYNNLGFDLYSSDSYKPVTDMINNMGSTTITQKTNNQYYSTIGEAVSNTTDFTSKHQEVGATLNL